MKQIRERISNWIKKLSIRQKLIFYSYLIISPILIVISTLLFIHNYHVEIKSEKDSCVQNILSLSDSVEATQKTVLELGTYITINTDINEILTADNPEVLNRDGQLWLHSAPMQVMQDVIALNGDIKTIAIYPENGVTPYLRCLDASSYVTNFGIIKQGVTYAQAIESKGMVGWKRIEKQCSDIYASNRSEKIVLFREIYDLAKKNRLGFLVIGANASKIDSICDNFLRSDKEEVIVVSKGGDELVRQGGVEDEVIDKIMEKETLSVNSSKEVRNSNYRNYEIYNFVNEATGTTVYKIVPKIGVKDLISTILVTPAALLLGFLIGLFPILVLISNVISKPLKKLTQAMHEFKKGDFSQQVEVVTQDEVGEASACFNEMVYDMKRLIDENYVMELKERNSELDALQAQINPHFLYNALDSLYWRTTEAGNDEVADHILALSDIFRLVLSRGEGIVAVRYEQELLNRYLQIQQMRFGNRLKYRITMEADIIEAKIPKLILQPFVENAIVHGFEKGQDNFFLSVVGKKDANYLAFAIEDTGVGMTKEQLEAIWKEGDSRKYAGQRIGRYAIKNVKERLELKYHDDYELKVQSEVGQGTLVTIRIPFDEVV